VDKPLFADEVVFVMAASHRLAARASLSRVDLRGETLLTSRVPTRAMGWYHKPLAAAREAPLSYQVLPLTEAVIDFARAGMGIGVLSEWVAEPHLRRGDVVASRAAPRLASRRATPRDLSDGGVAHAGHMKLENPRDDSWNRGSDRAPETRAKSQDRGDSCTLLKTRGWRTASLPRRRSPVRTRCSAPTCLASPVRGGLSHFWRTDGLRGRDAQRARPRDVRRQRGPAHPGHRPADAGGGELGFNGGELLHLAVAGCVSNDLFREARAQGIALGAVRVVARGDFSGAPAVSAGIEYEVEISGEADEARLRKLVEHVDAIAEIPNSLRRGTPVRLVGARVVGK
jgi:uncharacterized OsmC-like protein